MKKTLLFVLTFLCSFASGAALPHMPKLASVGLTEKPMPWNTVVRADGSIGPLDAKVRPSNNVPFGLRLHQFIDLTQIGGPNNHYVVTEDGTSLVGLAIGGDVNGTIDNLDVQAIQHHTFSSSTPAIGATFIGDGSHWQAEVPAGDVNTVDAAGNFTVQGLWSHIWDSTAPTDAQIPIYNSTSSRTKYQTVGGDATLDHSGNVTLATSGVTAGTYGDATHSSTVTFDAKGRATSASNTLITPAASSITGTLGTGNGGTGQTTYTDGQLLIGDSSTNGLDKNTITAGSGVSVANGHGTITISATGSGGTVTSITGASGVTASPNPITGSGTVSLNQAFAPTWTAQHIFDFAPATGVANNWSVRLDKSPFAQASGALLELGAGAFDGTTSGFFSGSANGTHFGINAVTGFTGNFVDFQKAGVSKFSIANDGTVNSASLSASQPVVTDASKNLVSQTYSSFFGNLALTGDVTSSGQTTTLATVNSNVGSFGDATHSATVTVNGKGLVTAASQTTITPAASSITGVLGMAHGGSGSDMSGTGGSGQYVKQSSVGGAFTAGAIAAADLPLNTTSQAGAVTTAPNDTTKFWRGDASWAAVGSTAISGSTNQTVRFSATNTLSASSIITNDGTQVGINQSPTSGTELAVTAPTSATGLAVTGVTGSRTAVFTTTGASGYVEVASDTQGGGLRISSSASVSGGAAGGVVQLATTGQPSANAQTLGQVRFLGSNGTSMVNAATIQAQSADSGGFTGSQNAGNLLFQTVGLGATSLTERMRIWANGDISLNRSGSALATNATEGFTWLPNMAGAPSGSPNHTQTGSTAFVWDDTNKRLMADTSGSTWVNVANGATTAPTWTFTDYTPGGGGHSDTIGTTSDCITVDTSAGGLETITLCSASSRGAKEIVFRNLTGGLANVSIQRGGSDTINGSGATTITLSAGQTVGLTPHGTDWITTRAKG